MHEIEPFYNWEKYYRASEDERSPLFSTSYNMNEYTHDIYGYYIHPLWDFIGSDTLYIKILYVNYERAFAIIEMFGEWNDALHNDIMHLKRNILDLMMGEGINHFILIGENVLNFHGSDDSYYEEWYEEVEDGWIAAINFRDFIIPEWKKFGLDSFLNYGGTLNIDHWRTMTPLVLFDQINSLIKKRLN
jgi:hypothetical protein